MLGYVNIDKKKLNDAEKGLFQTFMCGICVSTKELYGQLERNIITNDINILGILIFSYLSRSPEMYTARCVSSPFKKRSIFRRNEIFDNLATANILLCYANLTDDLVDGDNRKKLAVKALTPSYKKAAKLLPKLNDELSELYSSLRSLESEYSQSIDLVCDNSAKMLQSVLSAVAGKTDDKLLNLCYNIGKWVYLIDALDDLEKDARKKNYNPLLSYFGDYTNVKDFTQTHEKDLEYIFYSVLNQIATDYNDLNLNMYRCVLDNVIYFGIREKTEQILSKYKEKK